MAATTNNNPNRENLLKACKVITGKGILSYAFLWEPRPEEDDKVPKYSTSFLIPKSDIKTLAKIKNAINAAAQLGQTDKWGGKIPDPLKHPLRDGDAEADEKGPEYAGHYFLNASSIRRPRIVDLDIQDITDKDEVYSGCVARLSLNFFAYNHKKVARASPAALTTSRRSRTANRSAARAARPRKILPIWAILICLR